MTLQEYEKSLPVITTDGTWSDVKFECPKCGGGVRRNETFVLATNPPQYKYKCDRCGFITNLFG